MANIFFATLSPMLVIFICILIGYLLRRFKILPENSASVLSKLETTVLVPAVTVETMMKYCTVESLKKDWVVVVYSLGLLAVAMGVGSVISRIFVKGGYLRNVYTYALTFANFGFLGNAIVPAILGDEVFYKYLLFTVPLNIAAYGWGAAVLLVPKEKRSGSVWKIVKAVLLSPVTLSIIVGIVLGISGISKNLPEFVNMSLRNLASCMGPLAMVLTGFVIAGYKLTDLLKNKKIYAATALRLVVIPAVFIGALALLGAGREILVLALFAYATPLGMNTVVYPAAYGEDTLTGASMACISHTLSVISIPIMYAIFTSILGAI